MTVKIEEYVTCEQKNYYAEWFNDLSVEYAAKVAVARARMMAGSMGNVKPIDGTLTRRASGPGF
jgi:putative component of toxin-antitoxin plasmid stabilization module